jgi:peptidoglycan/LPS O-acetylase OafA/YrhL
MLQPADTVREASASAETTGQGGQPHRLQVHIPALDGLRGAAACAVVFGHLRLDAGLGIVHGELGTYAVLLFFILSGFLMGHLYLTQPFTPDNVKAYFAARISRIVPLYYAVGIAAFLYSRVDANFYYYMTPIDGVRHLLMSDSVSVFWSIAPEFQFYFLFPLLWAVFYAPRRWRTGLAVSAALLIVLTIAYRWEFPSLLVLSKLHIFLLGVGIAATGPFIRPHLKPWMGAALQFSAVAILLCVIVPPVQEFYDWLFLDGAENKAERYYGELSRTFLMGFCVFAFALSDNAFARGVFGNVFARRLGKYSFSIYLLHTPIIYGAVKLGWARALPGGAAIALVAVLTYLVSGLSYRWIEEPARASSKRALLRLSAPPRFRELAHRTFASR